MATTARMETRNQYLIGLSGCMSWVLMGYIMGYPSPAIQSIKDTAPFDLTSTSESLLGAFIPFAACLGALTAGWFQSRFGRRSFILVACSSGFTLGLFLVSAAYSISVLLLGRFIAGLAAGWCTSSIPLFIAETVHKDMRGAVGAFPQISVSMGFLLVYVLGTFVEWRLLSSLGIIFAVALSASMFFMPESPSWLMERNLEHDAKSTLVWLRGPLYPVEGELEDIQREITLNRQEPPRLSDLVSGWTWKPVAVSCAIMLLQQTSGINAILFFTSTIFSAGSSNMDPNVSTIIIGVVQVVFTASTSFYVDRLGRRPMLIGSSFIMGVSLSIMGGYYYYTERHDTDGALSWLPLLCLIVYIISFSVGFGPVPWIVMGEMMPRRISTLAASTTTCFNWIICSIVTVTFNPLTTAINQSGTFLFYAAFCFVATLFVALVFKETKCKSAEEIERMFRNQPLIKDDLGLANEGLDDDGGQVNEQGGGTPL